MEFFEFETISVLAHQRTNDHHHGASRLGSFLASQPKQNTQWHLVKTKISQTKKVLNQSDNSKSVAMSAHQAIGKIHRESHAKEIRDNEMAQLAKIFDVK